MRIAYVGDLHASHVSPRARLDIYKYAFLSKFSQILSIPDIQAIVQAGDVFDKEQHEEHLKNVMIDLLQASSKRFYCCAGNHDIVGDNIDTLSKTALGNLQLADALTVIPDKQNININNLPVHAMPYKFSEIEQWLHSLAHTYKDTDKDMFIVGHHFFEFGKCIETSITTAMLEKLQFNSRINVHMLLGHEHEQHEIEHINNISIYRPGCIMRRTIDNFNMHQVPKVYILTINDATLKVTKIEEHVLKYQSSDQVLNFSKHAMTKVNTKKMVDLQKRLDESLKTNNEDSSISQDMYDMCFPNEMEDFEYLKNLHAANNIDF